MLGWYGRAQPVVGPSGGRLLPRVPGPPQDLRGILRMLGAGSVMWYAAIVALPAGFVFARRIDTDRGWLRPAGRIAGAIVVLAMATSLIQYVTVYGDTQHGPPVIAFLPATVGQHLLSWIAIAGIITAFEGRRRSVHAQIERERLRAQVAEQRLVALTGQLQPHFLFNTLQSISTLIHRDPDGADEMLAKLSDLLRELLRSRDSMLVSLDDELGYTRTYLEIARVRFADRLTFAIHDTRVSTTGETPAVPLFVLQPLVENALAHGIGVRASGGRIDVTVAMQSGRVRLSVVDDGVGFTAGARREGIGLTNTRERLAASFGDDYSLTIASPPGGGTAVTVDIPFRPAPLR